MDLGPAGHEDEIRAPPSVLEGEGALDGRLTLGRHELRAHEEGGLIPRELIVQASVTFALAILAEAALSYLGLGTPPTTPSWGRMLMDAQTYLFNAPLQALWPGLAIAVAVLGFNLVGDGLRDFLDPRLRDVA